MGLQHPLSPAYRYLIRDAQRVIESVETLKGQGPPELAALCVHLAVRMLLMMPAVTTQR